MPAHSRLSKSLVFETLGRVAGSDPVPENYSQAPPEDAWSGARRQDVSSAVRRARLLNAYREERAGVASYPSDNAAPARLGLVVNASLVTTRILAASG